MHLMSLQEGALQDHLFNVQIKQEAMCMTDPYQPKYMAIMSSYHKAISQMSSLSHILECLQIFSRS